MWIAITEVRSWTLSLLRASRLMPHYAPIVKGLTEFPLHAPVLRAYKKFLCAETWHTRSRNGRNLFLQNMV